MQDVRVARVEQSKVDDVVAILDKAIAVTDDIMKKAGFDGDFEECLEEAREVAKEIHKNIK